MPKTTYALLITLCLPLFSRAEAPMQGLCNTRTAYGDNIEKEETCFVGYPAGENFVVDHIERNGLPHSDFYFANGLLEECRSRGYSGINLKKSGPLSLTQYVSSMTESVQEAFRRHKGSKMFMNSDPEDATRGQYYEIYDVVCLKHL